ncbi:unnamed protein product [Lampetra fluviatilis]
MHQQTLAHFPCVGTTSFSPRRTANATSPPEEGDILHLEAPPFNDGQPQQGIFALLFDRIRNHCIVVVGGRQDRGSADMTRDGFLTGHRRCVSKHGPLWDHHRLRAHIEDRDEGFSIPSHYGLGRE